MIPKLIIHIGAAKTGSSAIQAFLRRNTQVLMERGYVVPDRYLGLSSAVTGEHVWAIQEFINRADNSGLTDKIERAVDLVKDKSILISAENLSNIGNHIFFSNICTKIRVSVVVYVRRQDELLTSAWQQWHCKKEQDFNAWLLRAVKTYGRWDRLVSDWENIVGTGNVNVRIFERDRLLNKNLLEDFVAATGLQAAAEVLDYDLGVVNPSFSDIITPLVAGNKRLFEDINDNRFLNFLLRMDKTAFSEATKTSLISRELRESIVEFYEDVNDNVRKEYFPGQSKLFAKIDHSKYRYLGASAMNAEQMQFLTELIFRVSQYVETR